jgi:hypothetical protein
MQHGTTPNYTKIITRDRRDSRTAWNRYIHIYFNLHSTDVSLSAAPGKSTTIFHIIRTRVPSGTLALVTSVQNKAVEAIANKLRRTMKETPFFVFGHEKNLGTASTDFLLERYLLILM